MTASGADFALSIDAPASVDVSSDFDVVLRGTSVQRLIAYSALLDYDTTALALIPAQTGFPGTVWESADFQSVTEAPGGKIRVAAVAELPNVPGGPSSIAAGQDLAFLKLRFRAIAVKSAAQIGFAGTVDDNLLADENLLGHDTANGLELNPATLSVLDDIPEIDVTPRSLNYGQVLIGSSKTSQIVIESAGLSTLEVMSAGLGSGTSSDFQITSVPSLPAELSPGSSFVVQVRYRPSNVGADNGTLLIESDDPDEPIVTVSLAGSGVAVPTPEIDVFPVSINYGEIFVGSSSNRNVRVRNFGSGPLAVTSVQLTGAAQDFLLNGMPGLPATVPPGGELVFKVRYIPSNVGTDIALVEIESDDADEPVATVPLSGRGVELIDPEIDVSPLSVDFGAVIIGATSEETVRITNLGTTALSIATLERGPSTSGDFSLGSVPTLPVSLTPGGELLVRVIYGPSGVGADSGTLLIESNDADEPTLSIPLSGQGSATPAPEIDVSVDTDFGRVEIGSPAAVALRILNRGTLPLQITTLTLSPSSSSDYALSGVPGLPHEIPPAGELAVTITYDPRQLGSDLGTVVIRSNDEDEGAIDLALTGFGIPEQKEGIVAHLPLNCSAQDIINDETGLAIGTVRCGPDRFEQRSKAVEFGDGGFIAGLRFPVVAEDFILDAWVRPKPGSSRIPAVIFVIHNEQAPMDVPALTVEWDKGAQLVRVKRAFGESAEFGGLTEDWHHLLLAHTGGVLSLYVDGQLKDTMEDASLLGGAYSLGAAPQGVPAFRGSLDELILESGALSGEDDVIERILRGGPSVYVHPSDRVKTISVSPTFTVEALDLRLASANSAGQELTRLEFTARDVTSEGGGEIPALDYLVNGRLALQSQCGDRDSEVAVADLVVTEVDGGTARIELASPEPVLIPGDACLVALFDLDVAAPLDRDIQFSLETLGDLKIVDLEGRVQYLAGERLLGQAALQSDRMRIRTALPPELELEFAADVPTVEVTRGIDGAEMHVLTMAAGEFEGLQLTDVTYHAAARTSLDGVSNVRLFADLNSNGELDANETSHAGTIDVPSGSVGFSGVGIEIPAAGQVDLVLLADLQFFEEPVAQEGAEALSMPLPFSGPGALPRVPLLILTAGALALVLLARERYRPKLAGAVALLAVGCIFGFGAGCSGGGGGGGGGGSNTSFTQSFQLVIESADDLRVEGLQSRTEPALDDFPAKGIPGALYVITKPAEE